MKNQIGLHIIIILIQLLLYLTASSDSPEGKIILSSFFLVLLSFILTQRQRKQTLLKGIGFSVITVYFLMSIIISYQYPIELVLGNKELLYHSFFYSLDIISKMVVFSGLCLNLFFLGVSITYIMSKKIGNKVYSIMISNDKQYIKDTPILFMIFFSLILFFVTINKEFIQGGHGIIKANEVSISFLGCFLRFSILYIAIVLFNHRDSTISPIKVFNPIYINLLILSIIVFLLSHNRVYIIYSLAPILFSYFILKRKKMYTYMLFLIFFVVSIFATYFKIYGIGNIFSSNFNIGGYIISNSFLPFTAELAGSIYSQSLLFNYWYNGELFLYGFSFLVGIFRAIPGLMGLLNISPLMYDSATIATKISTYSYGVGTTSIIDTLLNFGFVGTLVVFALLGLFFSRYELLVNIEGRRSIYIYVIYLTICSFVFFIPRASFNDLIGTLIFNLVFMRLYLICFKNKSI